MQHAKGLDCDFEIGGAYWQRNETMATTTRTWKSWKCIFYSFINIFAFILIRLDIVKKKAITDCKSLIKYRP